MRFYKIQITNGTTGAAITPSSLGGMPITSLLPDGSTNIAALNVELDIPVDTYDRKSGSALVTVWGIGLQQIGNAFDLNDALISVYGGMSKGLPLANPAQQGLLVQGQILQAYGNWIGTDQNIVMQIIPADGLNDKPVNIVLNWPNGQTMATALQATLSTAFPKAKININISSKLVLGHVETGFYYTLSQFSDAMMEISTSIITADGYQGVQIAYDGQTITVFDGTTNANPKMLQFQDLIGQPTWIEPAVIQAKFVMRGDLNLGDVVTMPKSLATTTQQALLRFQDQSTFSGNYQIQRLHHFGNFRQPDAAAWNTTLEMTPYVTGSSTSTGSS